MNFDPSRLLDSRVQRAYAYWDSLRQGREMPARIDINPEDIVSILPYVLLVDVTHDPIDFRFRLAGTDVVNRFGEEITGKRLSEIDVDGKFAQIFAEYRLTVDRRQPELFEEQFTRDDGRLVSYSRLLCPLSADGTKVNMLFGVQIAVETSFAAPLTGVRKI